MTMTTKTVSQEDFFSFAEDLEFVKASSVPEEYVDVSSMWNEIDARPWDLDQIDEGSYEINEEEKAISLTTHNGRVVFVWEYK